MAFVRPEILRGFAGLGEPLALVLLGAFGLRLGWMGLMQGAWLPGLFGLCLVGLAVGWAWRARRAALLAGNGDGAGIVAVSEGRVAYLGPHGGGYVDRAALTRVAFVVAADGMGGLWHLTSAGDPGTGASTLKVPASARDAAQLVAFLDALPGARTDRAATLLSRAAPGGVEIWARDAGGADGLHRVSATANPAPR